MILAVPKNILSNSKKAEIKKKGYVIIECDDPDKIRIINTEVVIDTNDYFIAALYGLTTSIPVNKTEHFVNNLYKRLTEKSKP